MKKASLIILGLLAIGFAVWYYMENVATSTVTYVEIPIPPKPAAPPPKDELPLEESPVITTGKIPIHLDKVPV